MGQFIEFTNNNPLLVAGTIGMVLAVLFYEIRLRSQGLTAVAPNQAVQLINKGARVVDVRDEAAYAKRHIVDSLNVPQGDVQHRQAIKLKKSKTLLLVCDTGVKSGQCVAPWRNAGFEHAFSLKGGLDAWQRENLPLVSG